MESQRATGLRPHAVREALRQDQIYSVALQTLSG